MAKEEGEYESVVAALEERLERHDNSRREVQESLHSACDELRKQIDEMEEGVNSILEEEFTKEENRLQGTLAELRKCMSMEEARNIGLSRALDNAMTELLMIQTYGLAERDSKRNERKKGFFKRFELKTEKQVVPGWVHLKKSKIINAKQEIQGYVQLEVSGGIPDEEIIERNGIPDPFSYKAHVYKGIGEAGGKEYDLTRRKGSNIFTFRPGDLEPKTTYRVRMRVLCNDKDSEWSDATDFVSLEFSGCVWKEYPSYIKIGKKYSIDEENPRIATNIGALSNCTIIGNTSLPLNEVTSWSIKILKSRGNDGHGIYIGVAPSDINQNEEDNYEKCGWYLSCYSSLLWSGPPHNYEGKTYGPRKGHGQYVHIGGSVGVVIDTTKGELSFVLNGVNCGVAYEGIPLDRPLVPCVLLKNEGDSVELDTSEVKETVDTSINPSNVTIKSGSWDTITLTWDKVKMVSFYQIEVDWSKFWEISTTKTFTKIDLLPDTEHTFRVRAVRDNSVSEWSDTVKGRTHKAPDLSECVWRECLSNVEIKFKYSLRKRHKIAIKSGFFHDCYPTIIGNSPLSMNTVNSWDIKILISKGGNGYGIYIGVAPFNIDQNESNNLKKCGWYFDCYWSTLYSGPPHNYNDKEYGPRKGEGQYVHTGDNVRVMMDTTNRELSFVLKNVYFGVAYEGIPLDKPLAPCVLLKYEGDSIELNVKRLDHEIITF